MSLEAAARVLGHRSLAPNPTLGISFYDADDGAEYTDNDLCGALLELVGKL